MREEVNEAGSVLQQGSLSGVIAAARETWHRAQAEYENAWNSGLGHAERCALALEADDAYLTFLRLFNETYGRYPGPSEQ